MLGASLSHLSLPPPLPPSPSPLPFPPPQCPHRYLVSVMETFLLYKHFQRTPQVPSARQELADFWLGFLLEACQPFAATSHCPVRGPTELTPPACSPRKSTGPVVQAHGGVEVKQPAGAGGGMWVQGCGLGTQQVGGRGSLHSPPLPQVLVLELSKVLQPARLALPGGTEKPALTLSLVCPMEEVGMGMGGMG